VWKYVRHPIYGRDEIRRGKKRKIER